jgi:hypothetical protein
VEDPSRLLVAREDAGRGRWVLMAVGRERIELASTPDFSAPSIPRLTRLKLVQPWAVVDIPFRDK